MTPDNLADLTIIGVDHGARRIGVALRPPGQTLVLPLAVIARGDERKNMEALREAITTRKVDLVVMGLPLNADPAQAAIVKRFTRKLREGLSGVRFAFADETLTSAGAEDLHRDLGLQAPRGGSDSTAAALILESYLSAAARPKGDE